MTKIKERVKAIFNEVKFGEVIFIEHKAEVGKRQSNSDVLPEFRYVDGKVEVHIFNGSEKISNNYGWGWVHTNFPCAVSEKQRKKHSEAAHKRQDAEFKIPYPERNTTTDPEILKLRKAEMVAMGKICGNHSTKYGCSSPCRKALDFSKDRTVTKISGNIFYNNKYGSHSLDFVYFLVIKLVDGVPIMYVRRRPAKSEFMNMTAEQYMMEYVAKNKHVKNSFCICLYQRPKMPEVPRIPDLSIPALYPAAAKAGAV